MAFELEFNFGPATEVFNRLVASLPEGRDNLADGVVVPSHTPNRPVSIKLKGLIPHVPHIIHVAAEWYTPPLKNVGFVPNSSEASLNIPLALGRNLIYLVNNQGQEARFTISVTHYGLLFASTSQELYQYSIEPLERLNNNISSSIGYILASPLIADVNRFIPSDLEILGVLSNKLLVKNFLWAPGTDAGVKGLLSAFAASNPVIHAMKNKGKPENMLYRSEEDFSGYEAHTWLPNREVERWQAFIIFTSNLSQLYSPQQINEGEIYLKSGNRLRRHIFDFESDFANTVLDVGVGDECFQRLFRLDLAVDSEIEIVFCQASYTFDTSLPPLQTPDVDPLGITNWTTWTLSGRFEQQYGEDYGVHNWVYEPVIGTIDGLNRYFDVSQNPASTRALKLFIDGLLLRLNIDYRISIGADFRSGAFLLPVSPDSMLIDIVVGDPRPFLAPVFSSVEIEGTENVQFLVTAGNQSLTNIEFIVSEEPAAPASAEEAKLHYVTPALAAGSYGGLNQYGTETIPIGTTTFPLTYPVAATSINYQLIVQYAEDPAGIPSSVDQLHSIVRNHTLTGALIEFSEPTANANAKLHWWLIEQDGVALERGTISLTTGTDDIPIPFSSGPYLDQVIVILQLWHTTAIGTVDLPLVSYTNLNNFSFKAQFSSTIPDNDYRLDYLVFPSEAGNVIDIFAPPQVGQIVEAHYDTSWEYWAHTAPEEAVDGLRNTFTLPFDCPIPDAMYATLDGRLLTQGAANQYVVEGGNKIRLNFTPELGQFIWCVYPVTDLFDQPPQSSWNQSFLTRQSSYAGKIAKGFVRNAGEIAAGDTVSLAGKTLTAKAVASGFVINPFKILIADMLNFVELGITLIGVPPVVNPTTGVQGVTNIACTGDIGGSLNNTYFYYDTPSTLYYFWFNVGGAGVDPAVVGRTGVEITLNTNDTSNQVAVSIASEVSSLGTADVEVNLNNITITNNDIGYTPAPVDFGTGFVFSILTQGLDPSYADNEFPVNTTQDGDALSLINRINTHPVLQNYYVAEYLGVGVTKIKALALGGTTYNQTLTVVGSSMSATNITGDGLSSLNEEQSITFSSIPTSGKFNLTFEGFSTADIAWNANDTDIQNALNALPTLQDTVVIGDFTLGFTVNFEGSDGSKNQPLISVAGPEIEFDSSDVNTITNEITIAGHSFKEADSVGFFTSGSLPVGLTLGTTYYIHVVDSNTIKVLGSPGGAAIVLGTQGTGTHTITRNTLNVGGIQTNVSITETIQGFGNLFAVGVSREEDSKSLSDALNNEMFLNKFFIASYTEGEVSLTALTPGSQFNMPISVAGGSMVPTGMSGGENPDEKLPDITYKQIYYRDAPVITLDGVSTRKYDIYNGNAVQFEVKPVDLQEAYTVSQVFPVDYHPLDSMEANQPCSYPKGLFTQGLAAQFTDIELPVEQEGVLVITVDNLPIQEEPQGVIDGVNTVFTMTLESCAGQDSMMLFIDGIFQPPTTYTYSVFAGQGIITLSAPPVVPQKLWVWYLPSGAACIEEHVVQLTGVVDGINQNFGVPSSPFANKPALVLFTDGLFQLQDVDYTVDVGNTAITYLGALAPVPPQTLWGHFNEGNIGTEKWRQVAVGVGDDVTVNFTIPTLLTSELPTSQDSVLLALNGIMQREGVDFTVNLDLSGFPDGTVTFSVPPETGRQIHVAYIRRA